MMDVANARCSLPIVIAPSKEARGRHEARLTYSNTRPHDQQLHVARGRAHHSTVMTDHTSVARRDDAHSTMKRSASRAPTNAQHGIQQREMNPCSSPS